MKTRDPSSVLDPTWNLRDSGRRRRKKKKGKKEGSEKRCFCKFGYPSLLLSTSIEALALAVDKRRATRGWKGGWKKKKPLFWQSDTIYSILIPSGDPSHGCRRLSLSLFFPSFFSYFFSYSTLFSFSFSVFDYDLELPSWNWINIHTHAPISLADVYSYFYFFIVWFERFIYDNPVNLFFLTFFEATIFLLRLDSYSFLYVSLSFPPTDTVMTSFLSINRLC